VKTRSVHETALAAKRASRVLATLSEERRNAALEAMAVALGAAQKEVLKANAEDLALAVEMVEDGVLSAATVERLKLSKAKLAEMIAQVRAVAALRDPVGRTLDAIELDDADPQSSVKPMSESPDPSTGSGQAHGHPIHGLHMRKISVPLGVLAVIFEARPDAVTQIAALALKSGNAVILKPGREVEGTAKALVRVLREVLAGQGLPQDAVSLVLGRDHVKELLAESSLVDMVIPRGSKKLVEYVQANTRIPVLGHAEGVCHIYVDRSFDEAMALRVIEDAKCDYPAACNAVETVLVHRDIARGFLPKLSRRLHKRGVALHGCPATREILLETTEPEELAAIHDWHTEYGELAVSIGVVDSLDAAIEHIHAHGSSHTESIITEDEDAAERFLREVDAAGVLHNASTRFADGFRYGFGAEVGVSTSKFHARGPVGLDGLTTYKYVVRGRGHVAGDYRGKGARAFTHRKEVA
jgi:glutamate-5-semialdehyde dehydrogenase